MYNIAHKFISVKQFYAYQCNSEHIHFAEVVSKAIITGIYLIVYAGRSEAKIYKKKNISHLHPHQSQNEHTQTHINASAHTVMLLPRQKERKKNDIKSISISSTNRVFGLVFYYNSITIAKDNDNSSRSSSKPTAF